MGAIGISLIVASVIFFLARPTPWLQRLVEYVCPRALASAAPPSTPTTASTRGEGEGEARKLPDLAPRSQPRGLEHAASPDSAAKAARDRVAMPPPPPPPPSSKSASDQTTPKASALNTPAAAPSNIPTFSLDDPTSPQTQPAASRSPASRTAPSPTPPPLPSLTPPSLAPPSLRAPSRAPPAFPAANSAQRARGPVPQRAPASSSLVPPPTHSAPPPKPSRQVLLTPGHSPLDWARISGPAADLRNLPPATPYLKITPTMLRRQNGRRLSRKQREAALAQAGSQAPPPPLALSPDGTTPDAWMAIGSKVYNVAPYLAFHPGGIPELMRGAGRDASRLFGEVHPWVNYETMLSACLVGVLVDEDEGGAGASRMDDMD